MGSRDGNLQPSNTNGEYQQMYLSIYYNLCQSKSKLKESWVRGSGIHRHHIIPKHFGGTDSEDNYTYLSVREHIIAHFLLWKIYKNPNDLRSMKMLGAKLSPAQRKITGEFCRDNGIGIFSFEWRSNKEANVERCKNSANTQKKLGVGTFSQEGRKTIASAGGKVGGASQKKNKQGIHNPENFAKYASLGGKSIRGMICVTNGQHRTRIRPERLEEYLSNGYVKGFTLFS